MRNFCYIAIALCALSGCTYRATVAPSLGAASEVMANRIVSAPVSVTYHLETSELDRQVPTDGPICSAHTFTLAASEALRLTLDAVNRAAFTKLVASDGAYDVLIQTESVEPQLAFHQGFWEGGVRAHLDLTLRVSVRRRDGTDVLRTTLNGEGSGDTSGGCDSGPAALSQAAGNAIKRIAEQYADRIVNSGQMN
jgi:hypothetical protein